MLDKDRCDGVAQIVRRLCLDPVADAFAVDVGRFVDSDADGFAFLGALFFLVDGFQNRLVLGKFYAEHRVHLVRRGVIA